MPERESPGGKVNKMAYYVTVIPECPKTGEKDYDCEGCEDCEYFEQLNDPCGTCYCHKGHFNIDDVLNEYDKEILVKEEGDE